MSTAASDRKSSLLQAYLALEELEDKIRRSEEGHREPIAIIGMGTRFPGSGETPEEFWRLLRDGRDAIVDIPAGRWDVESFYDADPRAAGKMLMRQGGFLKNVDRFDAAFFNLSPREAARMDPQQRLLLEVAWEALENAGLAPLRLPSVQTGVYIGLMVSDYWLLQMKHQSPADFDAHMATGESLACLAGRLSYSLGLQGPSMVAASACSSSLVAVHLACQALRAAECDLALAGGVNLILSPELSIMLSRMHAVASDGRCKTFDASGDGYGRGEGCGVVVLKRLSDAIGDRDNILAVIRGSAVNHDGLSGGFTVPNGPAQEKLINRALAAASVTAREIDYLEAHGTGTALGDPIEMHTIGKIMGQSRHRDNPLLIGSVKTNIGHLEAAAGIAGLIKVALCLQHGKIPAHLHFKTPNPHIAWQELPVKVPRELTAWPRNEKKRLAGVSAFGLSGTNVHVIVEEAPLAVEQAAAFAERPCHLLTLSAKTPEALTALAGRYAEHLGEDQGQAFADVCYTANTGRVHFGCRLSLAAGERPEAHRLLADFLAGGDAPGVMRSGAPPEDSPAVAWLFTGQGAQYAGMGKSLYESAPLFRATLDECAEILRQHLDRPLFEILFPAPGDEALIDTTGYTQPALFALEYSLAVLWRALTGEPSAVMGHSVGEYVAACVTGVFSLADGLKLIAARARLMQALSEKGGMAAVMADEERVAALLDEFAGQVAIAAVNGPANVVIAGAEAELRQAMAKLEKAGSKATKLNVSHAFHSPLMEPMLDAFAEVARQVDYGRPQLPLVSNLTGAPAGGEVAEPGYWVRHVRRPVRFADGMRSLWQQGFRVFLEIGPRPVLLGMGRQCLAGDGRGVWLPSLRPGQEPWRQFLQSLGELYTLGAAIDWSALDRHHNRRRVALPTYPWQRQRYWVEQVNHGIPGRLPAATGTVEALHPLLGRRMYSASARQGGVEYAVILSSRAPAYLADHRVYATPIVPAAAYLEMAMAGGGLLLDGVAVTVAEFAIRQALPLPDGGASEVRLLLTPEDAGCRVEILSLENSGPEPVWTTHASGLVRRTAASEAQPPADLAALKARCPEALAPGEAYERFGELGIQYGPRFQAITALHCGQGEALGRVELPGELLAEAGEYRMHPVLLDGCLQVTGAVLLASSAREAYLPVGFAALRLDRSCPARLWAHATVRAGEPAADLIADINLYDEQGAAVGTVEGLRLRRASREALLRDTGRDTDGLLYVAAWQATALPETEKPAGEPGSWLVFADGPRGEQLAAELRAAGERAIVVTAGEGLRQRGQDHYELDVRAATQFEALLAEALGDGPRCRGIVHLWGAEAQPDLRQPAAMAQFQETLCASVLHLVQAVAKTGWPAPPRLWLVTCGAQPVGPAAELPGVGGASLWGLGRVIALEHPELRCSLTDLDPAGGEEQAALLAREILLDGPESQTAFRQGRRHVARLERKPSSSGERLRVPDGPYRLTLSEYGALENLALREVAATLPGPGELAIEVLASGLNFRDVLNGLGMLREFAAAAGINAASEVPFGYECAGRVQAVGDGVEGFKIGDEVLAGPLRGSLARTINVTADFVTAKPAILSFEEAATLPLVFLTVWYGLKELAGIRAGDKVLIHAAAGGVGHAAVQLARAAGAEIYATASPAKWDYLKKMGIEQVMSSRSLDFRQQILERTNGQGVDIVLNSLTGEFIPASLEVLAKGGRFVEIGKIGIWEPQRVAELRPDCRYHAFDLADVSRQDPKLIKKMLGEIVAEVAAGRLAPLPRKVFALRDTIRAFRYMAQARHIGKVVIDQTGARHNPVRQEATYLITGGLGALGLAVAEWLVAKGARHLVLGSRRTGAPQSEESIARLRGQGARVEVRPFDVAAPHQVADLFAEMSQTMPPLAGIVHAAGVLDDGILTQQTTQRFARVLAPKVAGTLNLHNGSLAAPLDFFVCFSSAAALFGSPGQGNYATANSFMDGLMQQRRALGLPALSINWGPWSGIGMAASLKETERNRLRDQGITPIAPDQGIRTLERLLDEEYAQVAVIDIDWPRYLSRTPAGLGETFYNRLSQADHTTTRENNRFLEELLAAPADEQKNLLFIHIRSQVGKILGMQSTDQITARHRLFDLGLDSLMAVELKSQLEKQLNKTVPSTLLFDYPTIGALTEYLGGKVLQPPPAPPAAPPSPEKETELEHLSEDDVADLLARELAAHTNS